MRLKKIWKRVRFFEKKNDLISAQRIKQKVTYDLEMIREFGYVKGIENYSRYFDGRKKGEPPFLFLTISRIHTAKIGLLL